jgi:hypothetical protein
MAPDSHRHLAQGFVYQRRLISLEKNVLWGVRRKKWAYAALGTPGLN